MSKLLYVMNVEDLIEDSENIENYEVGIEIVDPATGKRICYKADVAWFNEEWEEVTLTVNVENLAAENLKFTS